jgi:segregation and condensation protein B
MRPDEDDAPADESADDLGKTSTYDAADESLGGTGKNRVANEAHVPLDETVDVSAVDLTDPPPADEPRDEGRSGGEVSRSHLRGLLEALIFASDRPQKALELARAASAPVKQVRALLSELSAEYHSRGIQLDEVAGGWIFRTNAAYAPFVRDQSQQRPVRLSRAQVETLAILAYRQPVTRPEIDDIRGVDSGPVLKLLLERDLVRILGKKDEPGRPMIYGTTTAFLEFFGLKSLKDLPTLREFTELSEDSRRVAERELGDVLDSQQPEEPTEAHEPTTTTEPPPETERQPKGEEP